MPLATGGAGAVAERGPFGGWPGLEMSSWALQEHSSSWCQLHLPLLTSSSAWDLHTSVEATP